MAGFVRILYGFLRLNNKEAKERRMRAAGTRRPARINREGRNVWRWLERNHIVEQIVFCHCWRVYYSTEHIAVHRLFLTEENEGNKDGLKDAKGIVVRN
jgi:hypothetical protein